MSLYLSLPILFFKFWFIDSPLRLIRYFLTVNHAALQILSIPLLIRTFFRPLKNEYRKGLVVFSVGMGIVVKSALIFVDLLLLLILVFVELTLFVLFLL